MNKNIKQDYFIQIKKILDKADKDGENSNHFRALILMGDMNRDEGYSWLHAPLKDITTLLLNAMRNSEEFLYASASALEKYNNEFIKENNNEENPIQEA